MTTFLLVYLAGLICIPALAGLISGLGKCPFDRTDVVLFTFAWPFILPFALSEWIYSAVKALGELIRRLYEHRAG
ncbi:hypothetical protein JT317_gp49 [Klebsiella phage YMC16/01/N133_KPN_BP]|uniref:Uncharacterized protein n=1 Tax=Klebsiella phage YMC16/01/N133_KPN_BP TaxID=2026102 RepID=A0A248XCZ0_9CAUD|nr:hypothetical protein JT317_gp49 [Klebsiella phage YMC16/01/N133_KPN_BP]ASW27668.1 hypothetical protein KPNN133_049 [Klebsiella phage YMC16/01/N133_KPN_BP]